MDHFLSKGGVYHCEDVRLDTLADAVGTPAYVYSKATIVRHAQKLKEAFAAYPTLPCFAVKANSNLSVLRTIFAQGFGADLVSLGELERALAAGVKPNEIVFSGVGKRRDELERGLDAKILSFNVELPSELDALSALAKARKSKAPVTLRLNPNIDAKTNAKIATGLYTTKFGLPEEDLPALLDKIKSDPHLELVGIACHIGSQITELGPIRDAARRMVEMATAFVAQGHALKVIDMGGGLGVRYLDEDPPSLEAYARTLIDAVKPTGLRLLIEPGRVLVGNVGVLVSRVIGVKKTKARHFVILDAAMNDLVRPTLYEAYHGIEPVKAPSPKALKATCDFVGPICETGDYLGKDRDVALPAAGDLFLIRGAGAYGSSMASQYNSRARAPEILVDGARYTVVRPRETLASLWEPELAALDPKTRV